LTVSHDDSKHHSQQAKMHHFVVAYCVAEIIMIPSYYYN